MPVRAHRDKAVVDAKLRRIYDSHIKLLTDLVHEIREEHDGVAYFDPADGGTDARLLFLLEAPGPRATAFISQENDDASAATMYQLLSDAGLPRKDVVLWNVVPFYIGQADRRRIRAANQSDIDAGKPWLQKLIGLLPNLDAVVLLGLKAQRAEALVQDCRPGVRVLKSWHPSLRGLNRYPGHRAELLAVVRSTSALPSR
jgi:uracil-DNA glycosylase